MTLELLKKGTSENFLLRQLIKKNFTSKYKDSVLGILWSFLNPLRANGYFNSYLFYNIF